MCEPQASQMNGTKHKHLDTSIILFYYFEHIHTRTHNRLITLTNNLKYLLFKIIHI